MPRSPSPPISDPHLIDAPDMDAPTHSGHVTWDERGNGVWHWYADTALTYVDRKEQEDSILAHLDIEDLRIVETKQLKVKTLSGRIDIGQRFKQSASTTKPSLASLLKRFGRR